MSEKEKKAKAPREKRKPTKFEASSTIIFLLICFGLGAATAVLVGSILYKACIQAAMQLGFDPFMLKFITAALFLLVLIVSGRKGEEIIHA